MKFYQMKRTPEDRKISIPKPVGGSRMICKGGCGEEFSAGWLKWRGGACKECELQKQIDHLSFRCAQLEMEVAEFRKDPSAAYKRYKEEQIEKTKRNLVFAGVARMNEEQEAPGVRDGWIVGNAVKNAPNIEHAIGHRK